MLVGDLLIDETGHLFTVVPVGFKRTKLGTLEARTELALRFLSLGLERTSGWAELFEHDAALLAAAIAQHLRSSAYATAHYTRAPHPTPPALEAAP